eukprot:c5641_g1_i1.p1 GENE.c5641_g1_i1~~c5641_g1_i1.p1  ORF type:complete len:570 (+),score=117.73 c5641_g1_i1:40-1710(+)
MPEVLHGLLFDNPSTVERYPRTKIKIDELMVIWASLSDSVRTAPKAFPNPPKSPQATHYTIGSIEKLKPVKLTNSGDWSPELNERSPQAQKRLSGEVAPWLVPNQSLSPTKLSPAAQRRVIHSPAGRSRKTSGTQNSTVAHIPQFYFPQLLSVPAVDPVLELHQLKEVFSQDTTGSGITIDPHFLMVCKEVCGFPSFFATPFLEKAAGPGATHVTLDQLLRFWEVHLKGKDRHERLFNMMRQPHLSYLQPADFVPWLNELLEYHPGLEFLKATPDFQKAYVETVIARIFFTCNTQRNKRLSLPELRRSNIVEMFTTVDEETDINEVKTYFSYEHFYVIYCKFWELDTDHDQLLSPADLVRYGNYGLLTCVIDRIFSLYCASDKMTFDEFVYFIVAEEDKTTLQSLAYWFTLVDLDGDGIISPSELEYFYREQSIRLECIPHDPIRFRDVLCQMHDMIEPAVRNRFTLLDLKSCRMGGNLFNVFLNIHKFLGFEHADPFVGHEDRLAMGITDWDRFADTEYARLAAEEDEVAEFTEVSSRRVNFEESGFGKHVESPF